jgi:hypothetical protein
MEALAIILSAGLFLAGVARVLILSTLRARSERRESDAVTREA